MKKLLQLVAILILSIPAMAQWPVSDPFTSGATLTALGSNWTLYTNFGAACQKQNNTATGGNQCTASWNANAFLNFGIPGQIATAVYKGGEASPAVYLNNSGGGYVYDAAQHGISVISNAFPSAIFFGCPTPSVNDTISLSITSAGKLTCTDVTTGISGSTTDTTFTSGAPGIWLQGTSAALGAWSADCYPFSCLTFPPPSPSVASCASPTTAPCPYANFAGVTPTLPSSSVGCYVVGGGTPGTPVTHGTCAVGSTTYTTGAIPVNQGTGGSTANTTIKILATSATNAADSSVVTWNYTLAGVIVTPHVPTYGFNVLPGSHHNINVQISNGVTNLIDWTITTSGGATATFTNNGSTTYSNALAAVGVDFAGTGSTCTIPQAGGVPANMGTYTVTSTSTVTLTATSVDDPTASATFIINTCTPNGQVIIAPAYQPVFKGQAAHLQSWVLDTDETGTWSITGTGCSLADTTFRDAVVTGTTQGRCTVTYTSHSNPSNTSTALVYVASTASPIAGATPNHTELFPCEIDPAMTGTDYEIKPGGAFTSIAATGFPYSYPAGSTFRIWNVDTTGLSPTTYTEYFQVGVGGTSTQPIWVCGVPDSLGNLPIIDGGNAATTNANTSTGAAAGFGVVNLWAGSCSGTYPSICGPGYVVVNNLHIKNGRGGETYTPPGGGAPIDYNAGPAAGFVNGLSVHSGHDLYFAGDDVDNDANGYYTSANSNNSYYASIVRNVYYRSLYVENFGVNGSFSEHGSYNQAWFSVTEGVETASPISGMVGGDFKWRGIGGIFRYNICATGGPTRCYDLTDDQDSTNYMDFNGYLWIPGTPSSGCASSVWCLGDLAGANLLASWQNAWLQDDFVYGSIQTGNTPAGYAWHYGSDVTGGMAVRQGTLHAYNNTAYNGGDMWQTDDSQNNGLIGYYQPGIYSANNSWWTSLSGGAFVYNEHENIFMQMATNMFAASTISIATPITGGSTQGWGAGCDFGCPWPLTSPMETHLFKANGTVGVSAADYLQTTPVPHSTTTFIPITSSPLDHAGTTLTGLPAQLPVRYQYNLTTNLLEPRTDGGLTIGAEEQPGAPTPVSNAVTPSPGSVVVGSTLSMTCTTTFSDSSTAACSSPVWSVVTGTAATINSSTGVVTGVSVGSVTVQAIASSLTSPAVTVNVTATPPVGVSSGIGSSKGIGIFK